MVSGENTGMSLEDVLILTGEMEHMEELIRLSARDKSGFSPQEMLDSVIHPMLDELEMYIKNEASVPQDVGRLKALVHQWITSRMDCLL
ncbi:hypothetical protein [Methanogenium organophilum]|uniref:Uncharacterized protein n=1 Tax=Methanogenium organophilum TaxID=2199 RepID=A0A9X9S5L1_METOG|nr:hypothetical protein [Methanogenium organophilum]WAI02147.1 hypothetical protein OU421_04560 [Methanogenium organophilum]